MGIDLKILSKREEIFRLAAKHGASNIRVFGSAARDDMRSDSDVDFLVDIEDGRSLLDQVALMLELESVLGRKVDIVEKEGLHRLIRENVLREAVPL